MYKYSRKEKLNNKVQTAKKIKQNIEIHNVNSQFINMPKSQLQVQL